MTLRDRKWAKKKTVDDPLAYVFRAFYDAVPALQRYRIGNIEKRKNGRLVQGRIKGRYNADFELDAWKEDSDIIIKFNLFTMKGKSDGVSYRVSVPRAKNVAGKFAKWFGETLSSIRRGEV